MKKDVMIELTSIIDSGDDTQRLEVFTRGKMMHKDDCVYLSYKETEQSGYDGCTVLIKAQRDERVEITRSGDMSSRLIVENGRRNLCSYSLAGGTLMMGVTGSNIKNTLAPGGGELRLSYELDANSQLIGKTDLAIKIRESLN